MLSFLRLVKVLFMCWLFMRRLRLFYPERGEFKSEHRFPAHEKVQERHPGTLC